MIQQRLAAQAAGNVTGFADYGPGCLATVQVAEVLGVVEQAVGQVVGGGVLAQAGDRGGKRQVAGRTAVGRHPHWPKNRW